MVELEQTVEVRRLAFALAARQTSNFEAWESLNAAGRPPRRGGISAGSWRQRSTGVQSQPTPAHFSEKQKFLLKELGSFENNAPQIRSVEYRKKKFFVGFGGIVVGGHTVIGQRLKQSGMRWSVCGANAIIVRWGCTLSGRFEDSWAARTA